MESDNSKNTNENTYNGNGAAILLTAQDVASEMQISEAMAYHLMKRGEIRTIRFGRTVRVRRTDLEAFIQNSLVG